MSVTSDGGRCGKVVHLRPEGFAIEPSRRIKRPPRPTGHLKDYTHHGREATALQVHADEPAPTGAEGGCQWPRDDVGRRVFCGRPTVEHSSWCAYHRARVYAP